MNLTTTDVATRLDVGYGTAAGIISDLGDDDRERLGIARSRFGNAWEIPESAIPALRKLADDRKVGRPRKVQEGT